jgi:hypothetical protein
MKPDPESDHLLDDLLADDAALRERLLAETLREVRGRRRRRQGVQVVLLGLLVVGGTLWGPWRQSSNTSGIEVVRSVPLEPERWVITRASSLEIVTSKGGPAVVVTTEKAVPLIDDQELFALLAGRPAMLVRPLDGPARLILPDETAPPEDTIH